MFNDVAVSHWLVRVHSSIVARIGRDLPTFFFFLKSRRYNFQEKKCPPLSEYFLFLPAGEVGCKELPAESFPFRVPGLHFPFPCQ